MVRKAARFGSGPNDVGTRRWRRRCAPIAQRLITLAGWRSAYGILGAAVLVVSIPVVGLFLKSNPEDTGLLPDGETCPRHQFSQDVLEDEVSGGVAWTSNTFWLIAVAFSLAGGAAQACVIHLVPMLSDRGISAEKAALASSALGVAYIVGRVVAGYLVDRFFAPYVAGFLFIGMACGLALLWGGSGGTAAFLGASLIGLGMGGEPPGQRLAGLEQPCIALSPDGTQLAYVAIQGATQQLYLRATDSLEATPVPGTEGGVGTDANHRRAELV